MNQYSNRPARSSSRGRLAVVAVLILILSLLMSSTSATPVAAYAQEVTAAQVLAPEVDVYPATLVHTIDTYLFSPPSPDPTGITYISTSNRLLISDAEVEEMVDTLYDGVNLWETSLSGTVVRTSSTVVFPNYMFFEPEGVSYNPNNGHLFFADDDQKVVFEVAAGADGSHGTLDDVVTSFDTAAFGSEKPLGVAYSAQLNTLFIADYTDAAVYKVTPGANGVFDGVAPEGDDQVTSFSTASFGVFALEGIAFNPANGLLYLCGQSPNNMVAVVTTDGTLLWMIDISAANPYNPSDMAIAPSSLNPAVTHIYISDRGVDNDKDPTENDGKVFEMTLPSSSDTTPPDTTLTATPPDPDTDNTPTFSFTGNDPGGSGLAGFQCRLDAGGWFACTSPFTTPALPDGDHTFTVRAVDRAGNLDPTPATHTWTVDTTPPIAADDGGPAFTTGEKTPFTTANVLANDSDPGGGPILLVSYDDSALVGILTYNGDGTFGYDPNGKFNALGAGEQAQDTFTYTVTDAVGLTDTAQVTITITGANDGAPTISAIPDQVTLAGVPVGPVPFTVDDIDTPPANLTLTFTTSNPALVDEMQGVTFGGSGTARTLVVTPKPGVVGTALITVIVSDGELEASEVFVLTVNPHRILLPLILQAQAAAQ